MTATGPVDYALFANGKLIAFVEAKKISLAPQNVLSQAQRYVQGAESMGINVPFIYSTNGEAIWFQDLRVTQSRSRQIKEFHTPKALIEYLANQARENTKWFIENNLYAQFVLKKHWPNTPLFCFNQENPFSLWNISYSNPWILKSIPPSQFKHNTCLVGSAKDAPIAPGSPYPISPNPSDVNII